MRLRKNDAVTIIEALIEENHQLRLRLEAVDPKPVDRAEQYLAALKRESSDGNA